MLHLKVQAAFDAFRRKPLSVLAHIAMSEPRLRSIGRDGNE